MSKRNHKPDVPQPAHAEYRKEPQKMLIIKGSNTYKLYCFLNYISSAQVNYAEVSPDDKIDSLMIHKLFLGLRINKSK